MILKELIIKRKKENTKDISRNKNFEKWKNITNATAKLINYLLITKIANQD